MRPLPMVRGNALVPFVAFLDRAGAPAERLLQSVGVPPTIITEPERLLPLHQVWTFLGTAARTQGLDNLGLEVGLRTPFEALGAYARLGRGAATVHEALDRLSDAIALHNSGERVWLAIEGGRALCCHAYPPGDAPGKRQGELFALAMMLAAIRAVLGAPDWLPDAFRLPASEASRGEEHEATLGRPVRCAGNLTAVVFPRALLAAVLLDSGRAAAGVDDDHAFLHATAPAADFPGSVRQAIASLLHEQYPPIERTARAVGLSARTLQRRLAETGESYSRLVGSVRREVAARLLRGGDAKLIEIAGELGYADPANFTRAFRRWTGIAPHAYRRLGKHSTPAE